MSDGEETPKPSPRIPFRCHAGSFHGQNHLSQAQAQATTTSDKEAEDKFFADMAWELYKSGEYADLTIKIKDSAKEFRVHRAVVCKQSKFFEAACRGDFAVSVHRLTSTLVSLETDMKQEAANRFIELEDDDPEIVEIMIKYLYTHRYENDEDYDITWPPKPIDSKNIISSLEANGTLMATTLDDHKDPIPNCLRVFAMADKFLIPSLKDLARARFTHWAEQHWWANRFLLTVRHIFESETGNYKELRPVVLDVIVQNAENLFYVSRVAAVRECDGSPHPDDDPQVSARGTLTLADLLHEFPCMGVCLLTRLLDHHGHCARTMQAEISELQSEVGTLHEENKQIRPLQLRNQGLIQKVNDLRAQLNRYRLEGSFIQLPSPLSVELGQLGLDDFEDAAAGHAHPAPQDGLIADTVDYQDGNGLANSLVVTNA